MHLTPPNITVLIPCLNEREFIYQCISSLLNGSYPAENIEVLVLDGGSQDGTRKVVTEMATKHDGIRLLNNPKKIVPAALNLGVKHASNEILIWVGAHAIYDPNYLQLCVSILEEESCASVGGVITPIGRSKMGKAIAAATGSKFGIGNAKYRHALKRESVDTVFGGCWYKKNVLKVGGFNEDWVRNQDYEFNMRLRQKIGPILLDPAIRCQYFCRESISGLAKQYFQYGAWRFRTFLVHPTSFTARQAAPLMLLIGLLLSALLCIAGKPLGYALPVLYATAILAVSLWICLTFRKPYYLITLPTIFATLHLSWACGFSFSAVKSMVNKHQSR